MQLTPPCWMDSATPIPTYPWFQLPCWTGVHWWKTTKILLSADLHCQPPNLDPWSLELNQAYLQHCLWTIALSAHKNDCDMSNILTSLRNWLWPSPDDANGDLHLFSANLHHVQKYLCQAKCDAEQLQQKHLKTLLNEAKATNQCKKTSALTYLIQAEQNHHCYSAFCQHTKPNLLGVLLIFLRLMQWQRNQLWSPTVMKQKRPY